MTKKKSSSQSPKKVVTPRKGKKVSVGKSNSPERKVLKQSQSTLKQPNQSNRVSIKEESKEGKKFDKNDLSIKNLFPQYTQVKRDSIYKLIKMNVPRSKNSLDEENSSKKENEEEI